MPHKPNHTRECIDEMSELLRLVDIGEASGIIPVHMINYSSVDALREFVHNQPSTQLVSEPWIGHVQNLSTVVKRFMI